MLIAAFNSESANKYYLKYPNISNTPKMIPQIDTKKVVIELLGF